MELHIFIAADNSRIYQIFSRKRINKKTAKNQLKRRVEKDVFETLSKYKLINLNKKTSQHIDLPGCNWSLEIFIPRPETELEKTKKRMKRLFK